jgi:uncharacterized protein (UPF0335 family)
VALRVEDLLRDILERLAQIEREQEEVLKPFIERRKAVAADVKALYLDKKAVSRAARVLAKSQGSEGFMDDPVVALYLRTIQRG